MTTKLISVLQGKGQGFEEYIKELQDIVNKNWTPEDYSLPVLHQTSSSDGRIHTTIQLQPQQ